MSLHKTRTSQTKKDAKINFKCSQCGLLYPLSFPTHICKCGGFLEITGQKAFHKANIDKSERGIWRYRSALALPEDAVPVTLGEGGTPLVQTSFNGIPVNLKLDFLNPTGSFKDRGAATLVTYMRHFGIHDIVEDSSGNAGAAIAAYAAAARISCTIFVPSYAPEGKVVQIKMYGSEVQRVRGTRQAANRAAVRAAEHAFYASHLWHPHFIQGLASLAFELWEEYKGSAPDAVIVPVGSGGLLEGLFRGFEILHTSEHISKLPKIIGVQAANCPPIHEAFVKGLETAVKVEVKATIAEGISVQKPPRARAVLSSLRKSSGYTVVVEENEIISAAERLARNGIYVEPTSAAAFAGWLKTRKKDRAGACIILTGSGLKETSKYASLNKSFLLY